MRLRSMVCLSEIKAIMYVYNIIHRDEVLAPREDDA